MYKVIHYFTDLHDKNHPYNVGDIFPREGVTVSEERLAELAGEDNKQGKPLIEQVAGESDHLGTDEKGENDGNGTEPEKPEDEKADAEPEKPKDEKADAEPEKPKRSRRGTKTSGK